MMATYGPMICGVVLILICGLLHDDGSRSAADWARMASISAVVAVVGYTIALLATVYGLVFG